MCGRLGESPPSSQSGSSGWKKLVLAASAAFAIVAAAPAAQAIVLDLGGSGSPDLLSLGVGSTLVANTGVSLVQQHRLFRDGHSNLQFAVANSVEAVRCGASFIDTTLYGLGRSAGNVPTEIAVAVFNNLGIETGIDLFEVMDAAEEFMGPLMSQMQLYDMMSVAMGCSQFHSSFLPKVAAAARKHGVELRRLVVAMGKLDPVNLDEDNLNRVAGSLPKATAGQSARDADVVLLRLAFPPTASAVRSRRCSR